MPAVLKILLVFFGILVLARLRVPLGVALFLGGLILPLWAGQSWLEISHALLNCLRQSEFWLMLAVVGLIIELGRYMTHTKRARELVNAAQAWGGRHGKSVSLMAVPALIGLVPMPAGALFSAPLVADAAGDAELGAESKAAINYWFRHVWEYWWPLFPGVIVTMSLFGMRTWRFVLTQVPLSAAAIVAGYVFMIRPNLDRLHMERVARAGTPGSIPALLAPLVLVVLTALFLPPPLAHLMPAADPKTCKLTAMLIGLGAALLLASRHGASALRSLARTLSERHARNVLFTLSGILVFKFMLQGSGLLPRAGRELLHSGIPVIIAVALLPLLAGFVTGIAVGFAGTAFPLVVGLMAMDGIDLPQGATLVLAFGFGFMGMMLSPVHLCLLVSREYFAANMFGVYRRIVPCALTILVATVLLHVVYAAVGW